MKLKPNQNVLILTAILIVLCTISILFLMNYPGKNLHYTAHIYVDGILYESISLYQVSEPYSFTISTQDAHYNEIYVESGSIRISSADCPDLICVKQGPVTDNLLPITCLPHRLVIQLTPVSALNHMPDIITH